eukprot:Gregarina_sp_Pseudo_9__332@NODE_1214_length_1772_cov_12_795153_g1140_i0_p1_GENE_NODE_1214_length_1772_cov_12_795153_g1140_i0NODE_1214_length_1772_cov_12_795153_g1140_i0_p1_ORF_typecomplete_len519_score121_54UCH/PF00443_29/2_8e38UCH_1/PF13423_6/2e06Peptidase_C98/PF15499_6/15Peptidase_C98/PF15499_6/5_7e03Peptidase_C98/PF15499_6/0_017ubiquitin/PF00240_23/0_00028TBK1_ULD/PF18396_1/0_28_NODE_1214_length_1772_cov_12_795153_g1140_i0361592
MTVSLVLKWRGDEITLDCPDDVSIEQLANMIYSRTQVPLERQILMAPGLKLNKQILANPDQSSKRIRDLNTKFVAGASIRGTLIGTPVGGEFVVAPADQTVAAVHAEPILHLPKGYINTGNTCYLGSVLVLLEQCEGFRNFLLNLAPEEMLRCTNSIPSVLRTNWQRRYREPPASLETAVNPSTIFRSVCAVFPDFGTLEPNSAKPQMQDAEECVSRLLQSMTSLTNSKGENVLSFFNVEFEEETCVSPAVLESLGQQTVAAEKGSSSSPKLSCYMGTLQKPVSFLVNGIELAMEDEIEKFVPALSQNAVCVRKRRISRLPQYLIIHMVRFEWKKANALAGSKAGRAKVLKKVEYPNVVDLYNLCRPELQDHLRVGRLAEQALREKDLEQKTKAQDKTGDDEMKDGEQPETASPPEVLPCSGKYKLRAVVTHTGRSAVEGHYICWLWKDSYWIKMDDDKTSVVEKANINLQGGIADGPCPYILLYERDGEISEETAPSPACVSEAPSAAAASVNESNK